jgi:tetratricopeptide (TPR) repeat protein
MTSRTKAALGLAVATSLNAFAAPDTPTVGDLRKVGRTHLQTSCSPAVQDDLASGVALLHSFFYEEARRVFTDVAARDGGCAIAHWGIAMTWWHPIWTPPTADERAAGRAAIDKARSIGGRMPLERGLIDALAAYYVDPVRSSTGPIGQSCHGATGGGDHAARAAAYEKAMEAVHAVHRDDIEAGTFYALALLASAPPGDRTLKNQTRATEILEPLRRRQPDHPGVLHYLIHGYDYPLVAEKGLAAAKAYAAISPWVPHVLHMPSHIFTRLGMWDEVISSNLASSEASRQYEARMHPGATGFEELHAWDYMVYGYLQTAQDARALEIVQRMKAVGKTSPESDFVIAYAAGAVPARYALERRQWEEAAGLTEPSVLSVKEYPFGSGHIAFARALGAARAGRLDEARKALARLEELTAAITDPRQKYFALQASMQAKVVQGWLAHTEGRPDDAERLLREAADTDDALGKHPVSPASLVPAREVLADYLSTRGRFAAARTEYEACLKLNPRRLNSLYGAGVAAEKTGDRAGALEHFRAVSAVAVKDADRPDVVYVRTFLAANDSRASR